MVDILVHLGHDACCCICMLFHACGCMHVVAFGCAGLQPLTGRIWCRTGIYRHDQRGSGSFGAAPSHAQQLPTKDETSMNVHIPLHACPHATHPATRMCCRSRPCFSACQKGNGLRACQGDPRCMSMPLTMASVHVRVTPGACHCRSPWPPCTSG
jgi:hypothetical protein